MTPNANTRPTAAHNPNPNTNAANTTANTTTATDAGIGVGIDAIASIGIWGDCPPNWAREALQRGFTLADVATAIACAIGAVRYGFFYNGGLSRRAGKPGTQRWLRTAARSLTFHEFGNNHFRVLCEYEMYSHTTRGGRYTLLPPLVEWDAARGSLIVKLPIKVNRWGESPLPVPLKLEAWLSHASESQSERRLHLRLGLDFSARAVYTGLIAPRHRVAAECLIVWALRGGAFEPLLPEEQAVLRAARLRHVWGWAARIFAARCRTPQPVWFGGLRALARLNRARVARGLAPFAVPREGSIDPFTEWTVVASRVYVNASAHGPYELLRPGYFAGAEPEIKGVKLA